MNIVGHEDGWPGADTGCGQASNAALCGQADSIRQSSTAAPYWRGHGFEYTLGQCLEIYRDKSSAFYTLS